MCLSRARPDVRDVSLAAVGQLPPGPLFWRIDKFPTLAAAEAVAGPTGLAAEVAGKVWLFTLGQKGGVSPGGENLIGARIASLSGTRQRQWVPNR